MRRYTLAERRLGALALLIAAVALLWLVVAGPLISGFAERSQERAQLRLTLARNERLISALPTLRAEADRDRRQGDAFAIAAPSERLAGEILKARLQGLATQEGFVMGRIEDLPGVAGPGRVRVRMEAQVTLTQLCDSVRRLETEGAYVVVDYLAISAERALQSGHDAPLDVRLELTAAYRAGPARGA